MKKYLDWFQTIVEYLLSALWVFGGLSLIGMPPLEGAGVVVSIFGGQIALYVYIFWFTFLGCLLFISKVAKKKRLHKNTLLLMYLTTVYTAVLAVALFGLAEGGIIDDVVIGGLTAWFWIRWKMKTEYIDMSDFRDDIIELRK